MVAKRTGVLTSVGLIWLVGCGGAEFGEGIALTADRQVAIKPDGLAAGVDLPAARGFNVAEARSGQTNAASGAAQADPNGRASASAKAEQGGDAWAEFQLGQCYVHRSDQAAPVEITCKLGFDASASATRPSGTQTAGTVALKLFVKGPGGAILERRAVLQESCDEGTYDRATSQTSFRLNVEFQPQAVYYLIVAGRVAAASQPDTQAEATLSVKELNLSLKAAAK